MSTREQEKTLPQIDVQSLTNIELLMNRLPKFDPFNINALPINDSINFRGQDIPITISIEYPGVPTYFINVGTTYTVLGFHKDSNEGEGCPEIAFKRGIKSFYWVEREVTRSSIKGKGLGTFSVHLVDSLLQKIAKGQDRPLFVFADDDSTPRRWTTSALQSVGYSQTSRGIVQFMAPWKGPRLHKWYGV